MARNGSRVNGTDRDWHKRLAAIGIGLMLGLALIEALGRVIHYLPSHPSDSYVKLTNAVGPLPKPSSSVTYQLTGIYNQRIKFNELGFRGAMLNFPANDGRERILVLGDSYTAAWQVSLQQRWTEVMQDIHPGWVILNLGMPNWGTDQEYLTLLNYPLEQSPNIVLLMFYTGNDVADNSRLMLTGDSPNHPYFVPDGVDGDGELMLREIPWHYDNPFDRPARLPFPANIRLWLYLNSVNYYLASEIKSAIRNNEAAQVTSRPEAGDLQPVPFEAGVYNTSDTPEWESAWQVTEALLLELRFAAESRGARFVIVVTPPYGLVQANLRPEFAVANPDDFDLSRPVTHIIDFAQANGIDLFDLTPGFQHYYQSDPNHQDLFYPGDAHFTPLGNCLAAVLITNWLDPQVAASVSQCQ